MPCSVSLMEWQEAPVLSQARFLSLMAGRRAGKTDAIKARMKIRTQIPKFKYTYITPFSYQGVAVWRELMTDRAWGTRVKHAGQRPFPYVRLKNGAEIQFRNFQRPEGIKGTGENEICVDESQEAIITEFNFDTMLMPMLSDKRGTLLLAGQFRGQDWRYSRFWINGYEWDMDSTGEPIIGKPNPKKKPQFESWMFPTRVGFCFQGPSGADELALMRSICPSDAIWDQEWECKPRANAHAVFPAHEVDSISVKRNPQIKREDKIERTGGYGCAIDIGGVEDPEKVIIFHRSGEIVHAKAFPLGRDEEQNAREAMELARTFKASVVIDTTGEEARGGSKDNRVEKHRHWADRFQLMGFRTFVFQGRNKERLIENTRLAIQDKIIGCYAEGAGLDVCQELKWYEYVYKKSTKTYAYQGPDGKKDDYVQCVAMMVESLARGWAVDGAKYYSGPI